MGSWFVLGFVPLFRVGLCFNVVCLVFCVYRSFLCVRVSASGDVISGVCVVPDRSSLAESVSYLISSDKILFLMFVFCLSVVFLVLLLCVGRIR